MECVFPLSINITCTCDIDFSVYRISSTNRIVVTSELIKIPLINRKSSRLFFEICVHLTRSNDETAISH